MWPKSQNAHERWYDLGLRGFWVSIARWGIELGLNVRIYKFQRIVEGGIIGVWLDVFKARG